MLLKSLAGHYLYLDYVYRLVFQLPVFFSLFQLNRFLYFTVILLTFIRATREVNWNLYLEVSGPYSHGSL